MYESFFGNPDIGPGSVEVVSDLPAHVNVLAGADHAPTNRAFEFDAPGNRENISFDGPANPDFADKCDQVAIDGAVNGYRLTGNDESVIDGLARGYGHRLVPSTHVHRITGRSEHRQQGNDA